MRLFKVASLNILVLSGCFNEPYRMLAGVGHVLADGALVKPLIKLHAHPPAHQSIWLYLFAYVEPARRPRFTNLLCIPPTCHAT